MSFIYMVFRYPIPAHRDELARAMNERRDRLASVPGCIQVDPAYGTADGDCLVGISKWESKGRVRPGQSHVANSPLTWRKFEMYFFIKTQNPRPSFHLDMTPEERAIVFGPLLDPRGVYGIGVYQVRDEAEMQDLLELDPAKDLLRFEVVLPMGRSVVGNHRREIDG